MCTGEAEEPARLAGIRTDRMKLAGLGLSGCPAGVTGVLLTSSLSSSSPTIANEFLMTGIAAVLLGMTTVEPGKPNVIGTTGRGVDHRHAAQRPDAARRPVLRPGHRARRYNHSFGEPVGKQVQENRLQHPR
ncbi:MAG: hypothetical protein M5U09_15535 [Gammaproteobacteria bacterium]|nr:hypothetical protein [Gammaproteobacteria bacterium]